MVVMCSLRKQHKLLSSLLLAVLLSLLVLLNDRNNGVHGDDVDERSDDKQSVREAVTEVSSLKRAPKDYAYSPEGSRVRDMVGFFESLGDDFYDRDVRNKQNVVIGLSEAASKLRTLSGGFPLDVKCNKYVKLIDRPNIRSYPTVSLLVSEEKLSSETEQNDINFVPRLINERRFDALAKIQTIIQSLESERAHMRSTYEPSVQKDLLDCLNYYIYRHQRATLGLTDYIRESMEKLEPLVGQPSEWDVTLGKFQQLMEEIKQIENAEQGRENNGAQWLAALTRLHSLVVENQNELPKLIQKFVTEPARLERLKKYRRVLNRVDKLKSEILAFEGLQATGAKERAKYQEAILDLHSLVEQNEGIMSEESHQFIKDPKRLQIIDQRAKTVGATNEFNESNSTRNENQLATDGESPKPSAFGREDPVKREQVANLKSIFLESANGKVPNAVKKVQDRKAAGQILKRAGELKYQILTLEDKRLEDTDEYKRSLLELSRLTDQNSDIVPSSMQHFLQRPDRLKIIELLKSTADEPIEPQSSSDHQRVEIGHEEIVHTPLENTDQTNERSDNDDADVIPKLQHVDEEPVISGEESDVVRSEVNEPPSITNDQSSAEKVEGEKSFDHESLGRDSPSTADRPDVVEHLSNREAIVAEKTPADRAVDNANEEPERSSDRIIGSETSDETPRAEAINQAAAENLPDAHNTGEHDAVELDTDEAGDRDNDMSQQSSEPGEEVAPNELGDERPNAAENSVEEPNKLADDEAKISDDSSPMNAIPDSPAAETEMSEEGLDAKCEDKYQDLKRKSWLSNDPGSLDLDRAKELTATIMYLTRDCETSGWKSKSGELVSWPIVYMTRAITKWSLDQFKDRSLAQQKREDIKSILESLFAVRESLFENSG